MSRRKKNLRAFLHAHPEFSIEQVAAAEFAWDSAWVSAQKVYHAKSMQELEAELSTLKAQNKALVEAANSLVAKRKNMNAILRVQEMDNEYLNLIKALAKCGEVE